MRNAFADELVKIASEDPRVVLLSGDIGNRLFDPFKTRFPNRFYNCGVAEANMASMAAGMAMCGLRPVTYTITPFNTTRCLEQIRDDVCYHNVPVLIIGTGAGLSYASLGCTHHSCEDISFLRSLPNMTVLCPADSMELRSLLRLSFQSSGPIYMRIGKTNEPVIHPSIPSLAIGKGVCIQEGKDLCIISTGNMLPTTLETAQILKTAGYGVEVISMHTVKPLDIELLSQICQKFPLLATLEEHSLIGGLGSSIAEWMIDQGHTTRLLRFGTQDRFPHPIGSQAYTREYFGLTASKIATNILTTLEKIYAYTSRHSN
jgi:transketolase